MAMASIEIRGSASQVYAVLIDPETYPHWLVGAERIRDVDDNWPAIGSKFHHRVGIGPLTIPDSTKVLATEPERRLVLAARARPFFSAIVTFTLVSDGTRCATFFHEIPAQPFVAKLARPVLDPATHVRNQRSLERLAEHVHARHPSPAAGPREHALDPT